MKLIGRALSVSEAANCTDNQPTVSRKAKTMEELTVGNKYRSNKQHEGRGAWVLTAYTITGLALFGVLAYFFSNFIAH
jgi:hypothetical protein